VAVTPWCEVPPAMMPDTPYERFLRTLSYPIVTMLPALLIVIVAQAFLPPPRIGVDTVPDGTLRIILGLVAIAPVTALGITLSWRRYKKRRMPRPDLGRMMLAAGFGSVLATVVAASMGAALTPTVAVTVLVAVAGWIAATALFAAYIGSLARFHLCAIRRRRAEASGWDLEELLSSQQLVNDVNP
jgi:hypothetical protein